MKNYCCLLRAQEKVDLENTNLIVFAELFLGYSVNYQAGNNLFTFRNLYVASKNPNRDKSLSQAFIFPAYINGNSLNAYSLLYGKRFINNASSFSVSVGLSTNTLVNRFEVNDLKYRFKSNYIGFPFEVNYKLFKASKKRFRVLYGLVPVGQPTAFARSIGFKLYGNFSKVSHVGIGVNFGLGWHKKYN